MTTTIWKSEDGLLTIEEDEKDKTISICDSLTESAIHLSLADLRELLPALIDWVKVRDNDY